MAQQMGYEGYMHRAGEFFDKGVDASEAGNEQKATENFRKAAQFAANAVNTAPAEEKLSIQSQLSFYLYFAGDKKAGALAQQVTNKLPTSFYAPLTLFMLSVDKAGSHKAEQGGSGSVLFDWFMILMNLFTFRQKTDEVSKKALKIVANYEAAWQDAGIETDHLLRMSDVLINLVAPTLDGLGKTQALRKLCEAILRQRWDQLIVIETEDRQRRQDILGQVNGTLAILG